MVKSTVSVDTARLAARHALLIYGPSGGFPGNKAPGYIAHHPVIAATESIRLGTGSPVGAEEVARLLESVGQPQKSSGFLPPRVLALLGCGGVVWWSAPQRRVAWFRMAMRDGGRPEEITAEVPYPGLVFEATGRSLRVYAVKGNERPTPETVLHGCPVMNVFQNASLCTGSIKIPTGRGVELIEPWERGFYDSTSTSPNPGQNNQIDHKGGLLSLWRQLIKKQPAVFPEEKLRPYPGGPFTVGMLVEGKVRGGHH